MTETEPVELTPEELAHIRRHDSETEPKWFWPSLKLSPHNIAYQNRRALLKHIAFLEQKLAALAPSQRG